MAAETCEALAAAAATAHNVAADALAEAAHAQSQSQLQLQLATNNRAITVLIVYCQAEAAHIITRGWTSAAQYAYVQGDPRPQISHRRFDISMYYV
jgi:hypothetical protein